MPFDVPQGWVWTTLDEISSKIGSGSTPRGSNYSEDGIPFFRSQNVYNDGLVYEDIKFISDTTHQSMIGTEVRPKDLLLNITGGSLGRCAIVSDDFQIGNVSQHVCIIRPMFVPSSYVHSFILSSLFKKSMNITGSGREGLPKNNLEKIFLPLPPLAEQIRIVAEIERWFALIDTIKQGKENLQIAIKQAKSKILELAISGKLVPQDPNDEPASELLKRINPKAHITCDNEHYPQLPKGWCTTSLKRLQIEVLNGYAFQSCNYTEEGVRIIRIANVQDGQIVDDSPKFYPIDSISEIHKYQLRAEDLLMSLTGNVGRVGFLPQIMLPAALNQRVCCIRTTEEIIYKKYLYIFFQSNLFRTACESSAKGVAQLNVSTEWLKNFLIALPPLAEQKRIVEKIEQLFFLLEQIEESL